MSLFLAPIHTWLYNKIRVFEAIEQDIVTKFPETLTQTVMEEIYKQYGEPLPDVSLETIIDEGNIHGWLQKSINRAESRQAAIVHCLIKEIDGAIEILEMIYQNKGQEVVKNLATKFDGPTAIYNALNDFLLEGMPCDRVNTIVVQEPDRLIWVTTQCVHESNWENQGVNVSIYYRLRAAFSQGFVESTQLGFTYTYEQEPKQTHTIRL